MSIPVFCDAAFVILSHLNKTLSEKTKTPLVGLTVALSTGLFAPHVLVPPTPGPLAAASNLELENILLLICLGGVVAFILILVGGAYGNYLIKKNKHTFEEEPKQSEKIIDASIPSFSSAIQPILVPIILMGLGALISFLPAEFALKEFLSLITHPTFALGIGMKVVANDGHVGEVIINVPFLVTYYQKALVSGFFLSSLSQKKYIF